MRVLRHLLPFSYWLLRPIRIVRQRLGLCRPRLRVLLYHNITSDNLDLFRQQLIWIKRRWRFLDPAEFDKIISGKALLEHDSVLLTFDDGFHSNLAVAKQVLASLDIKAIFFVINDFMSVSGDREIVEFLDSNLRLPPESMRNPQQMKNLSWADMKALSDLGHTIGCHTLSHANLAELKGDHELITQMSDAKEKLSDFLGNSVTHFAFPFGSIAAYSKSAAQIAFKNFDFVFSGLRGDNAQSPNAHAIRRDALDAADSHLLVGAFLEGGADSIYAKSQKIITSWIGQNA